MKHLLASLALSLLPCIAMAQEPLLIEQQVQQKIEEMFESPLVITDYARTQAALDSQKTAVVKLDLICQRNGEIAVKYIDSDVTNLATILRSLVPTIKLDKQPRKSEITLSLEFDMVAKNPKSSYSSSENLSDGRPGAVNVYGATNVKADKRISNPRNPYGVPAIPKTTKSNNGGAGMRIGGKMYSTPAPYQRMYETSIVRGY